MSAKPWVRGPSNATARAGRSGLTRSAKVRRLAAASVLVRRVRRQMESRSQSNRQKAVERDLSEKPTSIPSAAPVSELAIGPCCPRHVRPQYFVVRVPSDSPARPNPPFIILASAGSVRGGAAPAQTWGAWDWPRRAAAEVRRGSCPPSGLASSHPSYEICTLGLSLSGAGEEVGRD